MAVPQWGDRFYDGGTIPVPMVSYRCKSTAKKLSELDMTHICKIGIDHDGDHKCICGKSWPQSEKVGI